jgi:Zn-dependent protease with chaperone function
MIPAPSAGPQPPLNARQDLTARGAASLAVLGLPVSLLLTLGIGLAVMTWAGCTHLSASWMVIGASMAVLSAGALIAGMAGNVYRTRRAQRLADSASMDVEDPERLAALRQLAAKLGAPVPALRAIPLDTPLAFAVLGKRPMLVVSTWVFDQLDAEEWDALVMHELAHMRGDDRLMRWWGSGFFDALKGVPAARGAWDRLEAAIEDAADHAVVSILGSAHALASARRKFLAAQGSDDQGWHGVLARPALSYHLALAVLGIVATLPLLPFVVVPLCVSLCAV